MLGSVWMNSVLGTAPEKYVLDTVLGSIRIKSELGTVWMKSVLSTARVKSVIGTLC